MTNFLDKLNTLVRASVNNLIDEAGNRISPPARLPANRLGDDIDSEIAALRRKIDDALNAEDAMQAKIDSTDQQVVTLDQQADDALKAGNDDSARQLVAQLQRLQRQNEIARSDLEIHRRSTSDFISRVNTLEAMVADAKHASSAPENRDISGEVAPMDVPININTSSNEAPDDADPLTQRANKALTSLSAMLRDARERVESALTTPEPAGGAESAAVGQKIKVAIEPDTVPSTDTGTPKIKQSIKVEIQPSDSPAAPASTPPIASTKGDSKTISTSDKPVDDDLARRRARLSKPE